MKKVFAEEDDEALYNDLVSRGKLHVSKVKSSGKYIIIITRRRRKALS